MLSHRFKRNRRIHILENVYAVVIGIAFGQHAGLQIQRSRPVPGEAEFLPLHAEIFCGEIKQRRVEFFAVGKVFLPRSLRENPEGLALLISRQRYLRVRPHLFHGQPLNFLDVRNILVAQVHL